MPHDVVDEMLLPRERLLADVAAVGRLAGVLPHVVHHVLLAREGLRAEAAPVGRLPRVAALVRVQVLLAGERLLARGAAVRLVLRVPLHVPVCSERRFARYRFARRREESASKTLPRLGALANT